LALSEPARVASVYPSLEPDARALRARFDAERTIADRALAWRQQAAKGARQATAVTAATVRVYPAAARMRLSVRNVFDWVPTSLALAAVVARFEMDSALLTEAGVDAGPTARQGGSVPVVASKRHATSYGLRAAAAIDRFLARPPRREAVAFALAREAAGDEQWVQTSLDSDLRSSGVASRIPYTYLTLHADGHYEATADWREDDRIGFDAVSAELAAVVGPVVATVNTMGVAAFPIGGTLPPPAAPDAARTAATTVLGAINVSAFWPHALPAGAFRELKARFRAYEKAGIASIRGLQQAGAYAFAFKKGIVAFDPRLVERVEASMRADTRRGPDDSLADTRGPGNEARAPNQYAWLTDPATAARWASTFAGRTVRIHHRATDLRIEIVGADSLAEYELVRRYLFSFLDDLLVGPDRIRVGDEAARARGPPKTTSADDKDDGGEQPSAGRRLRRLQESDPNLFDLKKYNPAATVYSVLCQSGRQPHVFNQEEAQRMPARRRAALVRYWNFTERQPAFYECPDPKYPHLSFRAGQHPLGWFLPCCKKTRPVAGSRAALVNAAALALRPYESADDDTALSRHVLSYGKTVPVGRIADPPLELSEGLFLDALPAPYKLQMVGVEQSTPAIPDAGYAYALAYALGLGDTTSDAVLAELADLAADMVDTFRALGGGGGGSFASARDLADALLGAFVRRDSALSQFGPGGSASGAWPAILAELARHAFGVEVVVMADPDGTGAVTLQASPEAAAALTGSGVCPGFVVPRVALLMSSPAGTFPLAALNPSHFLHVPAADRWMAARRTFGEDSSSATAEPEIIADGIARIVCDALASRAEKVSGLFDLGLLTRFSCEREKEKAGRAYVVTTRLVDLRNLCYGAMLHGPAGDVYVPVRRSPYPLDGTPTIFGSRPSTPLPRAALAAAIGDINEFIAKGHEPFAPVDLRAGPALVNAAGEVVGFVHDSPNADACLFFVHDPVPAAQVSEHLGPTILFPYDPLAVDAAVVAAARRPAGPLGEHAQALLDGANSRNRLYRLFLAEFSAVLSSDRDDALRQKLATEFRATRFESSKSVSALRRTIFELLRAFPNDLEAVRELVARAYVAAPSDPGSAAIEALKASVFDFDHKTAARLRSLESHADVVAALRALLAARVTAAPVGSVPAVVGNMFVSCAEPGSTVAASQGQCAKSRLVVPEDRLADFFDILAADVRNPNKTELLSAAAAGSFDALDFIRRPGEHLSLRPA